MKDEQNGQPLSFIFVQYSIFLWLNLLFISCSLSLCNHFFFHVSLLHTSYTHLLIILSQNHTCIHHIAHTLCIMCHTLKLIICTHMQNYFPINHKIPNQNTITFLWIVLSFAIVKYKRMCITYLPRLLN